MSGTHRDARESKGTDRTTNDAFAIDRLRVRALTEPDLQKVAPLLTLASAAGLATPTPVAGQIGPSLDDDPVDSPVGRPIASPISEDDDDLAAIEHDEYWLADHDGQILGFALLHHVDRQRAAIRAIWVDERFRRMGVGKRLLEGTVVHCQRAGYLKLVLELPFSLEKMVPLFGRLGFSFARRRDIDGTTLLEFYLDLYREPGL